jgi:predicted RNA-binding protein with PIN domain
MPKACRETVVDGYNLIHKLWPPRRGAAMAPLRERLDLVLAAYRSATRRHVTVVYDGGGGPGALASRGAVDVLFSGTDATADRRIADLVRALGRRAALTTVVSSDLEVRQQAVAWGAAWCSSEAFAEELCRLGIIPFAEGNARRNRKDPELKKRAPEALDDREVARWMKLFGDGA